VHAIEQPGAGGKVEVAEVPLRRAANALLADAYVRECEKSLARWNQTLASAGLAYRLRLPSPRFHRQIGPFAGLPFRADGTLARDPAEALAELPTAADREWLAALQDGPVLERGRCASWIAAPSHAIDDRPLDFEYVRFA